MFLLYPIEGGKCFAFHELIDCVQDLCRIPAGHEVRVTADFQGDTSFIQRCSGGCGPGGHSGFLFLREDCRCAAGGKLQNVLQHLVPIQMGETSPKDVLAVSMDTMDLYNEMLEQAQSEMRMEM